MAYNKQQKNNESKGSVVWRDIPHDREAEIGVVGSMLLKDDIIDDVISVVKEEDFFSSDTQIIFKSLVDMKSENKPIDLKLLIEHIREKGLLEDIGGHAKIAEIMCETQVAAHAVYYAEIVKKHAKSRELLQALAEIEDSIYESSNSSNELVSFAEEKIFSIGDDNNKASIHGMEDVITDVLKSIEKRQNNEIGVQTGFEELDKMLGGLHPEELIILAARPSMGKTALATNIAEYAAIEGKKSVLFVSLEMSHEEIGYRIISGRSKISGSRLKNGILNENDMKKILDVSSELSKSSLFIDDSPISSVAEIASAARRIKRKHGLDLIVIDYIGLIEPDRNIINRQEQVAKIARRLKGIARELKVPVLCLSQLNRLTESTKDNRPRLSHLRESGAIEQDADVVMFVHRDEYYMSKEEAIEENKQGLATVIVAKQRTGPVGDVELRWISEYTTFANKSAPEIIDNGYEEFEQFGSADFNMNEDISEEFDSLEF